MTPVKPLTIKILKNAPSACRPSPLSAGAYLSLALTLTLWANPALIAPAAADTLKGTVEETGTNPLEPMAVPVVKKKMQGSVDDNALKGQADQGDASLKNMNGQTDDDQPLKGAASDDSPGGPLKATLTQDQLQQEDPDRDDQMLAVEWDKWHNRLLWSIQSGVQEIVNSPENMVPHFDPQSGRTILSPNIPLGTKATFWVKVDSNKRVLDARIVQSSGNAGYDKALLDAIYSLDGSSILRYPAGSHRKVVNEAASILTSNHGGGREFFKFGDVEKYRVP